LIDGTVLLSVVDVSFTAAGGEDGGSIFTEGSMEDLDDGSAALRSSVEPCFTSTGFASPSFPWFGFDTTGRGTIFGIGIAFPQGKIGTKGLGPPSPFAGAGSNGRFAMGQVAHPAAAAAALAAAINTAFRGASVHESASPFFTQRVHGL
jgi:hypothetical protein